MNPRRSRIIGLSVASIAFLVSNILLLFTGKTTMAQTPAPEAPSAAGVAWSPDGTQLAVAGNFGVALYTSGFQLIRVLSIKGSSRLAWSPDGRNLAIEGAINNGTQFVSEIEILNIQSAEIHSGFPAPPGENGIIVFSWSADSQYLALAYEKSIYIWDPFADRVVKQLTTVNGLSINDVAWSPDGSRIAAVGGDGSPFVNSQALLSIWSASTGANELLLTQIPGIGEITSLAWSPDSAEIALGVGPSSLGAVPIFNLQSRQFEKGFDGPVDVVPALKWSPQGQRLAGADGAAGQEFFIWDTRTKAILFDILPDLASPSSATNIVGIISWKPDGNQVAVIREQQPNLTMYDTTTGTAIMGPELPLVNNDAVTPASKAAIGD